MLKCSLVEIQPPTTEPTSRLASGGITHKENDTMQKVEEIQAIRIEFLNESIENERTNRDWHAERLVLCDKRIEELCALRDEIIEQQHA